MPNDQQYDNHIWLTVGGQSWAIRAIHRTAWQQIFYLWRGYEHDGTLRVASVDVSDVDWDLYCQRAVDLMNQNVHYSPLTGHQNTE